MSAIFMNAATDALVASILKTAPKPINLLWSGVDISGLVKELEANPQLWDDNQFRRTAGSPHLDLSDIIVRYNDWANFKDRVSFNEEHESVWWNAYKHLPSLKPLVFDLMRRLCGERLGMVLITRIPPRASCKPHKDTGWHSRYYDKCAIQIKSNEKQAFCFESCKLVTKPGDVYSFDNSHVHWVTNDSDEERITLIVSIRNQTTAARQTGV